MLCYTLRVFSYQIHEYINHLPSHTFCFPTGTWNYSYWVIHIRKTYIKNMDNICEKGLKWWILSSKMIVQRISFLHKDQFSCSVMSDSIWLHGLWHSRLLCPSPTPGAYSNSCPSCWRCHPTISFSIIPFSYQAV